MNTLTATRSNHRRSVALIFCGLVLLWVLSAVGLYAFYADSVASYRADAHDRVFLNTRYHAHNQSALLNAKLNELDGMLLSTRAILAQRNIPPAVIGELLALRKAFSPEVADFVVLDASGSIVAWTRDPAEPKPHLNDRGYFQAHVWVTDDKPFLSSPDVARITDGPTFVAMSRAIRSPEGQFLGVIAVAIRLEELAELLSGVTEWETGMTTVLADQHGRLILRRPFVPYQPGQVLESIAAYRGNVPDRDSFVLVSPFDGNERRVSFERVQDWPWLAFVGSDLSAVYADIARYARAEAIRLAVSIALVTVLMGFLGWLTWRRMQSEQRLIDDIIQRKAIEKRLEWQANHDALTELPNRKLFYDRFTMTLQRCERYQYGAALIYIDLDGFKAVNDRWGHAMGDALLMDVARRLLKAVRSSDTVARLAGDEFVVLAEQCDRAQAKALAEKLRRTLMDPLITGGETIPMSASLGYVVVSEDGTDMDTLMNAADRAMYRAKNAGKNCIADRTSVVAPLAS